MWSAKALTRLYSLVVMLFAWLLLFSPDLFVEARSIATPWTPEMGLQNLVYGAASMADVSAVLGPPDEVVRAPQMYPIVENYIYYEAGGNGAATLFVFENTLLVGMLYKSPTNQLMDLTYFLPTNGDNVLNQQLTNHGFRHYYPGAYGLYSMY